ncbi:MAG: enoyl-CoA hydratase [Gammaproteobacteria bacterium]|nr:MAG: enoyl-CoA hydratase [Gammaproteobacteria bacterium]
MQKQHYILVTEHDNGVYQLTLNRPKVYNALCDALVFELSAHITELEKKDARAFVLTGNQKAFAAGGDIAEMQGLNYADVQNRQYVQQAWLGLETRRTPLIAAVNGFAFGGGCELVLLSDIVVAGRSAVFAQPETGIGIIPGAGGTQRLIRAVGKAKAMQMILAGHQMGALEAERSGLVSQVVDDKEVLGEALRIAGNIANRSKPVIQAAREAVNFAQQSALSDGLDYEKQRFYGTFALEDQSEGMQAFLDKRQPDWRDN